MARLAIFYPDAVVQGDFSRETWEGAPGDGVQVIRVGKPYPDWPDGQPRRPWAGIDDRQLWTGEDTYDPFGWGEKRGSLISDEAYRAIWEEAAHGDL